MKSKITLIILIVVIIFLGALSIFLGYNYSKRGVEIQNLNAKVDALEKAQELGEQRSEDTTTNEPSQVIEKTVEKAVIPKFDSSKVDNSKRNNFNGVEQSGTQLQTSTNIVYRVGPAKSISTSSVYDMEFQLRKGNELYNLSDANIVDVKIQSHSDTSRMTESYIIVLFDDGTVQYALDNLDSTARLEFKKYDLNDVVALINIGSTQGRPSVGIGAMTSDGVTHVLPYDMP